MPSKAIRTSSDSQNPVVKRAPRKQRFYTLTKLGHEAVKWIEEQEQLSPADRDEFAFFCPDCGLMLSQCNCPPFLPVAFESVDW